jgi:hypothetical protein
MFTTKPVARLWRRHGMRCLVYRDITGWWLVLDRDGEIVQALSITGPMDAIATALDWRRHAEEFGGA